MLICPDGPPLPTDIRGIDKQTMRSLMITIQAEFSGYLKVSSLAPDRPCARSRGTMTRFRASSDKPSLLISSRSAKCVAALRAIAC
jgi:hypothetical protein